jgi:hypothetical protein
LEVKTLRLISRRSPQHSPASSYLSSSDPRIHFGLGKLNALETVTIRWPSGNVEVLHDVPVDQVVRVVEGKGIVAVP